MKKNYTSYINEWKKRIRSELKKEAVLKNKSLLLAKKASDFLVEKYRVKKVILFGSLVWGKFGEASDIDLGLEGLEKKRYLKVLVELESLVDMPIDIKFLEEMHGFIKDRIYREGKTLYAKN